MDKLRVDKWLWCMRVFKTRTMASDACRKSRILVDGMPVKPSRDIAINDVIIVRKPPVIHTFRVKNLVNSRLPAKKVPDYMEDLTSSEELDKLKVRETIVFHRERGSGRPTKKERRDIDRLKNQ